MTEDYNRAKFALKIETEIFVYSPTLASYSFGRKLFLDTAVIRIRILFYNIRPNGAKFLSISLVVISISPSVCCFFSHCCMK